MARVVVIGGSGHVGTYLIPALVERGHAVVNVSRGLARPYTSSSTWQHVEQLSADRPLEERDGTFASRIKALKPDIVIDMISFELTSTQQLVEALRGEIEHFIHCSTLWVYGHTTAVPADENEPLNAFGEYGINKAEIERWLVHEARTSGFPATIFRPGHIVGPGWAPINPLGHLNIDVFQRIARGQELTLPNLGLETVHHVHAEDVAQIVLGSMSQWRSSVGEVFNAVSDQALNLRGYAEAMFDWFGFQPQLAYAPLEQWMQLQSPEDAQLGWEHIARSSCLSINKARRALGYQPRYTSLAGVQESVSALIAAGQIETH
ncbi:NAD-dependent epimerase/dehydratase family protein [Salinisphaera sp. SPP-AMP-43]|uniref:NAD-dependent epimerase/dehydratase family protein n=1 Tax=Salinisphaera sp. SPP-AMP-43 TaxID=3121288 RepID=UPI003C6E29DF